MKTQTSLAFDAMSGTAGEVTARSTRFSTPQQKDMRTLFARAAIGTVPSADILKKCPQKEPSLLRTHCVEDRQEGYAYVGKDCHPHGG